MSSYRQIPSNPYVTQLHPLEEVQFQNWIRSNNIPWQDEPNADYDMRGFFKDKQARAERDARIAAGGSTHFPDTYKTPFHTEFSNESKYATPGAPHWVGDYLYTPQGIKLANESQGINMSVPTRNLLDLFSDQLSRMPRSSVIQKISRIGSKFNLY